MSIRNNVILILIFLLTSFVSEGQQTPWPFANSGQQATVFGTTGEYRATNRFHKGVDMANGSAVYAITSGPVNGILGNTPYNNRVVMGNTRYWHVTPIPSIQNGTKTTAVVGELIGNFAPIGNPHLHLENENFIYLDNHLFPFVDNTQPTFITTHVPQGATFYRNGLVRTSTNFANTEYTATQNVNSTSYTVLYNKVDMAVHVEDTRLTQGGNSAGGRTAAYQMNWTVRDLANTVHENGDLTFDGVPNNNAAGICFHPESYGAGVRSIHIITSHPRNTPYDRYWNTAKRQGVTENWQGGANLESRYNLESETGDDLYQVTFDAFDVDFNGNPNNTASNPVVRNILIDNFRPYVKRVEIRKNNAAGTLVYSGDWTWGGTSLGLNTVVSGVIESSENVYIKVFTSEPLSHLNLSVPTIGGYSNNNTTPIANTNNMQWDFTIPASGNFGLHTLNFTGVDYANNPLELNPTNIPIRQDATTWSPVPNPGTDVHHSFTIEDPNIDIGPYAVPIPASSGVFSANEQLWVQLKNYGPNTINLSTNNIVTVLVDITGPVNTFLPNFQYSGPPIPPGGFQNVLIASNVDFSLPGTYNIEVKTISFIDNVPQNDVMNFQIVSVQAQGVTAEFYADNTNVPVGNSVNFFDQSTGGVTNWNWSFPGGTPSSSTAQHPQNIVYNTPGVYNASLVASNPNGADLELKSSYIYVVNSANLIDISCGVSNFAPLYGTPVTHYAQVNFSQPGVAPYQYRFVFGDGTPDYVINGSYNLFEQATHIYQTGGNFTYTLVVTDANNNVATCSENITVNGGPLNVDFTMNGSYSDAITIPVGGTIQFQDATTGGSVPYNQWIWDWDPELSTGTFPITPLGPLFEIVSTPPGNPSGLGIVTYPAAGTYKARLDLSDQNWYNGVKEKTITVTNSSPPPPTSNLVIHEVYLNGPPCYTGASINLGQWVTGGAKFPANSTVTYPHLLHQWNTTPNNIMPNNDGKIYLPPNTIFPIQITASLRVSENILVIPGGYYNYVDYHFVFTVYDGRVVVDAGPDITLCNGFSYTIGGNPTASGGTPPYYYNWQETNNNNTLNNLNIPNPVATANGTLQHYTVTVSDNYGCVSVTDNVNVITQDLIANAGPDLNICLNSSNQTIGLPPAGGTSPFSYSWGPTIVDLSCTNCQSPTVSPSFPGAINYTLTVTDAVGCTDQDVVTIQRGSSSPVATINPNLAGICQNEPSNLTGLASNGIGPYTYLWSDGSTTQNVTITPTTTTPVTFTVTDQATGCYNTDGLIVGPEIIMNYPPLSTDYKCGGSTFNIGQNVSFSGGTAPFTYLWAETNGLNGWFNDATLINPTVTPTETVYYELTVTDAYGCKAFRDGVYTHFYVNSNIPVADFEVNGGACMSGTCFSNLSNPFWTGYGYPLQNLSAWNPTSYVWDFGAGASPATHNEGPIFENLGSWDPNFHLTIIPDPPCVTYNSLGPKVVTLTATNTCGTHIVQKTINVTSPLTIPTTNDICGPYNPPFNNFSNPIRGRYIISGSNGCPSNNLPLIASGSVVEALALENVNLSPGFRAEGGCSFGARIDVSGQCYNITSPKLIPEDTTEILPIFYPPGEYKVDITPNPTKDNIYLVLPDDYPTDVYIYNQIGELVYNSAQIINQEEINLINFPKGIYFVKIVSGPNSLVEKVVKQ